MTAKEYFINLYSPYGYEMKDKHDKSSKIFDYYDILDFAEQYHKYKSKPKGKTLEERRIVFTLSLNDYIPIYGTEIINEFYEYWTEHGENDKKMRFEKEKSFGIKRRLATWKKNSKKWDTTKPVSLADKMKQRHGL